MMSPETDRQSQAVKLFAKHFAMGREEAAREVIQLADAELSAVLSAAGGPDDATRQAIDDIRSTAAARRAEAAAAEKQQRVKQAGKPSAAHADMTKAELIEYCGLQNPPIPIQASWTKAEIVAAVEERARS